MHAQSFEKLSLERLRQEIEDGDRCDYFGGQETNDTKGSISTICSAYFGLESDLRN